MKHDLQWVTAPPLWELTQGDPGGRARFRQPALLRFDTDAFMDDLIALMETGDPGVAGRVAKPETWERPAAGWVPAADPSLGETLRLYQPVHSRFYVTAASLVCRRAGLPDRRVDRGAGDRTSMVIRRLVPKPNQSLDAANPETFVEQAWVGDRKAGAWKTVAGGLAAGEERLPLFPLRTAGDAGRTRQAWAGLLPVASRELYEGARPASAAPPPPAAPGSTPDPLADLTDPRRALFAARIIQGLAALLESPPPGSAASVLTAAAPDMRELLAFAALDLVDFLQAELTPVWDAVVDQSSTGLTGAARDVYDALGASFAGSGTWRDALRRAEAHRPALLGTGSGTGAVPVPNSFTAQQVRTAATNLIHGGQFQAKVFAALGPPPADAPAITGLAPVAGARAAEAADVEGAVYWLRFAYERPICEPFHGPVLSEPSRPFRLAPFFDPDAPARPLVIRMPLDTSPRGLRKFPKGVAVLMSNKLRQQIERVRNVSLEDIDKGEIPDEPGWSLGMICSLSIPIITICALIVLMIFLYLLNIVFWWVAFFKICLPIPVRSE